MHFCQYNSEVDIISLPSAIDVQYTYVPIKFRRCLENCRTQNKHFYQFSDKAHATDDQGVKLFFVRFNYFQTTKKMFEHIF